MAKIKKIQRRLPNEECYSDIVADKINDIIDALNELPK